MKMERGLILVAGFAVAASACASAGATGGTAGAGTGGGSASASAVRCAAGTPANTSFASSAQNALNRTLLPNATAETKQGLYTQAQEQARQGIAADASNPLHHFLAAQAAVGLGNYAAADSAFRRTVELCPEYAAEVTPMREQAAAAVLDAGEEAYNRQDTATALANWQLASRLSERQPGALYRIAEVYGARGDVERGIPAFRTALAALERATPDSANAELNARLRAASLAGMMNLGVQQFQRNQFVPAAAIFNEVHTLNPNHHDAWLNHAVSLYRAQNWQALVPVAQRLIQMEPLSYDMRVFLFNAYKGISEAGREPGNGPNRTLAVRTLAASDSLPVRVSDVQLTNGEGTARVAGTVTGMTARAGTPIRMEFTFFGPNGPVGTQSVTVNAPAKDATAPFEATVTTPLPVIGWSYRVGS
jgi:tetratricopeptide (TPR) repeat protein